MSRECKQARNVVILTTMLLATVIILIEKLL